MKVSEVSRNISRFLSSDYQVVTKPDFPHISLAPDILIGSNGNLVGIFVPHSNELKDSESLLARLAISRLALPPHFRCVLVADSGFFDKAPESEFNFHRIVESTDPAGLETIIKDKNDYGNHVRPVLPELRLKAFSDAQILVQESEKNLIEPVGLEPETVLKDYQLRNRNKEINVLSWKQPWKDRTVSSVTTMPLRQNRSVISQLNPLCVTNMMANYVLDNGTPYLLRDENDPALRMILVDELPFSAFDPMKPIRVAAFCGIMFMRTDEWSDIDKSFEKVRDDIAGRNMKNERSQDEDQYPSDDDSW